MSDETGPLRLPLPALSLVALVGASGSGKTSFAAQHFRPTEVLSSDAFRGLVSDDENDQSATADAFDALFYVAAKRLAAGRLTVIDATNVQQDARRKLVALAREHDVLPVAIVLDLPERTCLERNAARGDRSFGPGVVRRQRESLRRSLRSLAKEGFRTVHVLREPEEVARVEVVRTRLYNDLRDTTGPFDVVGDVHGCREELEELLGELGWVLARDEDGRAVGARHLQGRTAVFLGDLVDRGPDTPGILRLVMGMVAAGTALAVPGNHESKLVRALRGRPVTVSHGLAESLEQLERETPEFRRQVEEFLDGLVSHYVLDGGRLVVAHAGVPERYQGRASGRVREFCLYGDTTGESDEFGLPVRYPWARDYRGRAMVLYGHTPVPQPEWVNGTMCLDTGCVFGGRLTAMRYPEKELVSVPARAVHAEPVRPLGAADAPSGPGAVQRDPAVLEVGDVLGRRVVETSRGGRVTVPEENAAAALEVLSRFATDPRWLVHLPPTMAPVATSAREGVLEHPDEAFAAYAAEGVEELVCQEKHMGSRAVVVLPRSPEVAERRFGAPGGATGAVYTRTGRSFFDPETTERLLARARSAAEASGLFDELSAEWLVLDAELLPWSAKADALLREQFAVVAAAGESALSAATDVLTRAAARGADVQGLLDRQRSRLADVAGFRAAYRRYSWPVDGPEGVQLAPFQVLASAGTTYADRPHAWHLEQADRLVAADPALFRTTRRVPVQVADAASRDAAVRWWEELTDAGGEGMVVKPAAGLVRGRRGAVQPGLKVRGPDYLRLVYGPSYREPANLTRLRERNVGPKRSLALREHALGLEAVERAAAGEPLWRVHECVAAVLALESEPVDPRL
ncbi:polynucleotide 3'-phosphatase /polynucleotide 5'-hydroxyl-kinase /polynucleotide 2',3'-cyclic phosphate phosphodiesterase [Motilibacter rhizosphaerae]|uniref:Polynucleotide 3'-phosphatase /polynucleotide 5'-hydroxyl-kinase /polynucleotide 2',3'-cyclic phosphate phosphodiesterase n=1 Tax=Motilibacter rhizosphaerae TaxID=598652 RepID=A0A4Q7NWG3_9ACTN|nr:polynucleotide kinase-phosphatase [Motilibacter rhizosphaerae]RZS91555.1 polynucleotide 3'-phosphatase /polynucleotide 5'-hydroxyl-kinase /polynucleotide 2',3'-cyclic phosphate phosphodiesterase [Motilibacter rhizosphaerae]